MARNKRKQYQINKVVALEYRNENEWEFTFDHTAADEGKINKYQVLAMMLVGEIVQYGIPQEHIGSFIGMCQKVFAL